MPSLESAVTSGILRLAILTRQPGEELLKSLNETITWPEKPVVVPMGLPSDLLRRRPDVVQAERELAAAVRRHAGEAAMIQRCQVHKRRNVIDHLSEEHKPAVKKKKK